MKTRQPWILRLALVATIAVATLCGCGSATTGGDASTSGTQTSGTAAGGAPTSGATTSSAWPAYASLWATPQAKPWLVLVCQATGESDDVPPSQVIATAKQFLTRDGAQAGGLYSYFRDVSYGAITMDGPQVMGPYTVSSPPPSRGAGWTMCAETADEAAASGKGACDSSTPYWGIDFRQYYGVISVFTHEIGAGANAIGQTSQQINCHSYSVANITFDAESFFTGFAAHELGHGYGLDHSTDSASFCEYCDQWDIMSALHTFMFHGTSFVPLDQNPNGTGVYDGPGMSVPNLLKLGWIPAGRIATYHVGAATQYFNLAALSHPSASGALAVKIVGDDPHEYYTLELRHKDGWDAGIPEDAVVAHIYKEGMGSKYSILQDTPQTDGRLTAGMTWTASFGSSTSLTVTVQRIDSATKTAVVMIGPSSSGTQQDPTVQITSPGNGQDIPSGKEAQVTLQATASADATQYWWTDSLGLFTDQKQSDTITVPTGLPPAGYCPTVTKNDTISLTVIGSGGQMAIASPVSVTYVSQC